MFILLTAVVLSVHSVSGLSTAPLPAGEPSSQPMKGTDRFPEGISTAPPVQQQMSAGLAPSGDMGRSLAQTDLENPTTPTTSLRTSLSSRSLVEEESPAPAPIAPSVPERLSVPERGIPLTGAGAENSDSRLQSPSPTAPAQQAEDPSVSKRAVPPPLALPIPGRGAPVPTSTVPNAGFDADSDASSDADSDADNRYQYVHGSFDYSLEDRTLPLVSSRVGRWRAAFLRARHSKWDLAHRILKTTDECMGTTIAVRFTETESSCRERSVNCKMYDALQDLHRGLTEALGDQYYPQQNAHFTIGAGNLDPTSAEEFNRWNSSKEFVLDLEQKLKGLRAGIREGKIQLPAEWRNFFERVITTDVEGCSGTFPVSQTDAVRRAMALFGTENMPSIPTVSFTDYVGKPAGVEMAGDVFVLYVDADPEENVFLSTKTWNELWKYVPKMALKKAWKEFHKKKEALKEFHIHDVSKDVEEQVKMVVEWLKVEVEGQVTRDSARGGYELTSIQMYRVALFCLGQQIKQFKKESHMNLGFVGPREHHSRVRLAETRQTVDQVLAAWNEKWKTQFELTSGFPSGRKPQPRKHRLQDDPSAKMTAFFYFESSLAEASSIDLLADPRTEKFSAVPTTLRSLADDDQGVTPDLRETDNEGQTGSALLLTADTIFRKDAGVISATRDLDLSVAQEAVENFYRGTWPESWGSDKVDVREIFPSPPEDSSSSGWRSLPETDTPSGAPTALSPARADPDGVGGTMFPRGEVGEEPEQSTSWGFSEKCCEAFTRCLRSKRISDSVASAALPPNSDHDQHYAKETTPGPAGPTLSCDIAASFSSSTSIMETAAESMSTGLGHPSALGTPTAATIGSSTD